MKLYLTLFAAALSVCLTLATSHADKPVSMISPKALAIKQTPSEDARTLTYAQRGEKVWKMREEGSYTRVKLKRDTKWIAGYIVTVQLNAPMEPEKKSQVPGTLALGFGGTYSRLSQNGKTFEGDDEVKYTLSTYSSQTFWPFLTAQWEREDFWRLQLGIRTTAFKGSAKTDVTTNPAKTVAVDHKMFMLSLTRSWSFGSFYLGGGFEVARAFTMRVRLGATDLVTTSSDLPTYLGGNVMTGYQFYLNPSFSLSPELRLTVFMNQAQPIYGLEGVASLFYWF